MRPIRARKKAPVELTVRAMVPSNSCETDAGRRPAPQYRDAVRAADTVASALLARLPRGIAAGAWRRGEQTVVGVGVDDIVSGDGATALAQLDQLAPGTWVGWCAFELGHTIEPVRATSASREARSVPDVAFARFGAHATIGEDGTIEIDGAGMGRSLLDAAVASRRDGAAGSDGREVVDNHECASWRTSLDRPEYEARVEAIIDLLRAGECYQVNLTRRLTREGALDPVVLYERLTRLHEAPYTSMVRLQLADYGDVAVVSASPERFLSRRGRAIETRPIKGTASDADTLRGSVKDHAENLMIVDLARNDLGRVCVPGSINVPERFAIEAHPGLHHLVSTVRGTLRDDISTSALLAATLPPASVTGAPKPRVLQAIEDLEPVRRGVYCGAFGWIDTSCDEAELAVAIRTFTVFPDRTELGIGAGIVADSSPEAEWHETELKARRLLAVAGADTGTRRGART
jgi:para-aminobenzoate synthetase component 1